MDRDHSRIFNVHAWSEHKAVKELVDEIFASLSIGEQEKLLSKSNNKGKSDPHKQLRTVMADLYVGWKTDPTLCTAVSHNNNDYKPNSRYNALHIPKRITEIFDILYENAYLDRIKGAYNHENPTLSRRTRYRPTALLQSLFGKIGIETYDIDLHQDQECIILRDKGPDAARATDLEYDDTNLTCSMRSEVQAYNNLMNKHYVDVATLQEPFIVREVIPKRGKSYTTQHPVDQNHKFTRRIFSRGSWELNGRWNGGFWQNLPKHMRRDILIDGEPTDEIDYSGLHPSLLALKQGFRLTGDPYDLDKHVCPRILPQDQRQVVKQLVLIGINAKNRNAAFRAFHKKNNANNKKSGKYFIKTYKTADLDKMLDAFIDTHPYLADSICADQGIKLMNVDSNITTHIINQFVALGKPILPIHDSYIVKTEDRQLLRSAMSKACVDVVGTDIEAEARSDQEVQYLKYATTWRARDRDFYLDAVMQMQLPLEVEGYRKRYEDWKKKVRLLLLPVLFYLLYPYTFSSHY